MASSKGVDRRNFLAAITTAGVAAAAPAVASTQAGGAPREAMRRAIGRPTTAMVAVEGGIPQARPQQKATPGSDFMVDVIKSLKIDYVTANPSSSMRGLQEFLIDHGRNTAPELLTCMHESSSVAMGHGYFKITGKPIIALVHSVVGLQNASMAICNAWCDRVPVIVITGNHADAAKRPPLVPTYHAAQDAAAMVRDLETTKLCLPLIERHRADPVLATHIRRCRPASCSRSTRMICSSVNLERFIRPPPARADSTQNWQKFRGSRQSPSKERECVSVQALPVLAEAAASVEPGYVAFHDPAFGQHHEPAGIASPHDLDVHVPADAGQAHLELRPLIPRVGIELEQECIHPE